MVEFYLVKVATGGLLTQKLMNGVLPKVIEGNSIAQGLAYALQTKCFGNVAQRKSAIHISTFRSFIRCNVRIAT